MYANIKGDERLDRTDAEEGLWVRVSLCCVLGQDTKILAEILVQHTKTRPDILKVLTQT